MNLMVLFEFVMMWEFVFYVSCIVWVIQHDLVEDADAFRVETRPGLLVALRPDLGSQ